MGIGDWGLGIGDWANPQSPIPNPQSPFTIFSNKILLYYLIILNVLKILNLYLFQSIKQTFNLSFFYLFNQLVKKYKNKSKG